MENLTGPTLDEDWTFREAEVRRVRGVRAEMRPVSREALLSFPEDVNRAKLFQV